MADFTKEIGHEAKTVGFEDEGEDSVGGADRQAGQRNLQSVYQISQTQYYQWRDKFLSESHRAFEGKVEGSELSRLKAKNQRLQQIIGALTVELKKSEDEL